MSIGSDIGEELAQVEAEGGQVQVSPGQMQLFRLEQGLSTLTKISLMFASIGVAALAVAFVEWLANLAQRATSWLSFFGISTSKGIAHGAQWLTNRIGAQYNKFDAEIGSGLTEVNTELKLLGADVLAAGFTVWRLTKTVGTLVRRPNLAPTVQRTSKTVKVQGAKITNVTRKVVYITKVVPRGTPTHLPAEVHTLQAQVHRQAVEIAQLQKQAKTTPHPSTLAQAAPVVALGLAALGLNSSRCEGPREFNKALCEAGPQGLGNLLNLLGLAGLFVGLVELAKIEQGLVHDVSGLVHDFWGV